MRSMERLVKYLEVDIRVSCARHRWTGPSAGLDAGTIASCDPFDAAATPAADFHG